MRKQKRITKSPYNLRGMQERESPPKDESNSNTEEESEADEDELQEKEKSHMSRADTYSDSQESSTLSSTFSSSFDYHSGPSPSFQSTGVKKLYPPLPQPSASPKSRRRQGYSSQVSHATSSLLESSGDTPPICKKESSGSNTICGYPVLTWLAVICIVCLIGYLIINKQNDSSHPVSNSKLFEKQVDQLQKKYPGQSERFWRTIKSSARHVLQSTESAYPVVLLMVGERRSALWASGLAQAVAQTFEGAVHLQQPHDIDLSLNLTSSADSSGEQKLKLDRWLKEKLDQYSAVILNHLENLLPEAALLLHGYCDGENAPHKRAMLILGLYLEQQVYRQSEAESALKKIWNPLSDDKIGALLSRVANNILLLRPPLE